MTYTARTSAARRSDGRAGLGGVALDNKAGRGSYVSRCMSNRVGQTARGRRRLASLGQMLEPLRGRPRPRLLPRSRRRPCRPASCAKSSRRRPRPGRAWSGGMGAPSEGVAFFTPPRRGPVAAPAGGGAGVCGLPWAGRGWPGNGGKALPSCIEKQRRRPHPENEPARAVARFPAAARGRCCARPPMPEPRPHCRRSRGPCAWSTRARGRAPARVPRRVCPGGGEARDFCRFSLRVPY